MTTTAKTGQHLDLISYLGPRGWVELTAKHGQITDAEADLLLQHFAAHPVPQPTEDLILRALDADGGIADENAYAALVSPALSSYLAGVAR